MNGNKVEKYNVKRQCLERNSINVIDVSEVEGRMYAIKRYENSYINNVIEIGIMRSLGGLDYVMNMVDVFIDEERKINIVMPLATKNLYKITHRGSRERLKHVMDPSLHGFKRYLWQMAYGLYQLHSRGIWHRDIKSENILYFRENDMMRISDFNVSYPSRYYTYENDENTDVYTSFYRPPEMCFADKYKLYEDRNLALKCDVWALGCIFYEMLVGHQFMKEETDQGILLRLYILTGHEPFHFTNFPNIKIKRELKDVISNRVRVYGSEYQSEGVVKLISKMMEFDLSKRYSIIDVLNDDYLSEFSITQLPAFVTDRVFIPSKNNNFPNRVETLTNLRKKHLPQIFYYIVLLLDMASTKTIITNDLITGCEQLSTIYYLNIDFPNKTNIFRILNLLDWNFIFTNPHDLTQDDNSLFSLITSDSYYAAKESTASGNQNPEAVENKK